MPEVLPEDMAEKFNTYFSSVFTTENMSSIPSADYVHTGCESDKLHGNPDRVGNCHEGA